ncbi:MAG: thiamine phosphate synthase [Proteobacteria bacterium]|nr:thiamine phosphate synthase [Pseudomonadota bacterium]
MERGKVKGKRRPFDLLLYLVTDPDLSLGRSEEEVVARAVSAGVTIVQYRDKKNASTRKMVEKTRALATVCRPKGVALIVNDRIDVALAGGADGVHLGQDDMDLVDARRILGPDFIIGVSVTTAPEVKRAEAEGADYLAANGVFPTPTKPELEGSLGIDGVRKLAGLTNLPVAAIGGINAENAGSIMGAGAAGVAVVSFIMGAEDVEGRCREMLEAIKNRR